MSASTVETPPRVLIVPGLYGSGEDHWQTWLQHRSRGSRRVEQSDWAVPDLDGWAARIGETLELAPRGERWIAVAHSFGCLALLRHLQLRGAGGIHAAILAAPADPRRFGAEEQVLRRSPLRETLVVASRNDPWLSFDGARAWSTCWDVPLLDAGEVGHINPAAGFGPWPLAAQWVERQLKRWHAERRLERAHPFELSWAV
jgi:predicted alpha/beta hydrolase family esterase